ncbi:MAG: DciA family protein [Bacteroidota bacterium]|jgi:hypothetical protein
MSEISLQEAFQKIMENSRLKNKIQALQIKDLWKDLMGKTIAGYTDDIQIIEKKLIITTHVAPLKQELIFQREKIKNRLNEMMNEYAIHEVVIK